MTTNEQYTNALSLIRRAQGLALQSGKHHYAFADELGALIPYLSQLDQNTRRPLPVALPVPEADSYDLKETFNYFKQFVVGWNSCLTEMQEGVDAELDARLDLAAGTAPTIDTALSVHDFPAEGSIWSYKNHPERLYEVLSIVNVAHTNVKHPAQVLYRTCKHPSHFWARTVTDFLVAFSPTPSSSVAGSSSPVLEGSQS